MKRLDVINIVAAIAALVLPPLLAMFALQRSPDAFAADLSIEEATIHAYGNRDKSCLEWTDSCRTCGRGGDDAVCSNIGIACQPKPIVCTKRREPPKPEGAPKQEGVPK